MVALVDSSCGVTQDVAQESKQHHDLVVHIFMDKAAPKEIQGGLNVSDILIMKDMKMELYQGKLFGKVFSIKQVIKLSSKTSDPLEPITCSKSFKMTDGVADAV